MTRPAPSLTPSTTFFWSSGQDGRLRIQGCGACRRLHHPPGPRCPHCGASEVEPVVVRGRATVIAATVNRRRWQAEFPDPYVIAVVALDEDPDTHLTTNIVGCDPDEVTIGMRVRVVFEPAGEAWVPLFEPDPYADAQPSKSTPHVPDAPAMASSSKFEDRVAITGIGLSDVGRRLMRDPLALTVDACTAAVQDAGLSFSDIDGLSTYPGQQTTGMSEGGIAPVEQALGIRPTWFNSGFELPGQLGAVVAGMLAVASGLCRHVLCYRTVWQATEAQLLRTGALTPDPAPPIWGNEWRAPYGATKAINLIGAYANHYMHRYGAPRETLGWIALNARRNAALNPDAIYRTPLTMDQYLEAEILTTPFGLYDCDLLCDGAVAVVISARDTIADLPTTPVLVEAVGTWMAERPAWDQGIVSHEPQIFGPAAHMWSRTTLHPEDVDVAELYDGFTFNALSWLEALGFCEVGGATDLIDGGRGIALDGTIPLNTHGGQLSAGRLHGFGYLHEAVVQLRGDAGARQVDGARTAVVSSGGLQPGGAMLLTRSS